MGEKVGRTQQNRPRGCVVRQPAARFGQQKDFKVCVCVFQKMHNNKKFATSTNGRTAAFNDRRNARTEKKTQRQTDTDEDDGVQP